VEAIEACVHPASPSIATRCIILLCTPLAQLRQITGAAKRTETLRRRRRREFLKQSFRLPVRFSLFPLALFPCVRRCRVMDFAQRRARQSMRLASQAFRCRRRASRQTARSWHIENPLVNQCDNQFGKLSRIDRGTTTPACVRAGPADPGGDARPTARPRRSEFPSVVPDFKFVMRT
jgi:hypothetical protein